MLAAVPSGWFYLERVNYNRALQDYLLPAFDVPDHRVNPDARSRAACAITSSPNEGAVVIRRKDTIMRGLQ